MKKHSQDEISKKKSVFTPQYEKQTIDKSPEGLHCLGFTKSLNLLQLLTF